MDKFFTDRDIERLLEKQGLPLSDRHGDRTAPYWLAVDVRNAVEEKIFGSQRQMRGDGEEVTVSIHVSAPGPVAMRLDSSGNPIGLIRREDD